MVRSSEEILAAIDLTLDQLVRNAEALLPIQMVEEIEIEALQKTQESLLSHLLHMSDHLNQKERRGSKHKNRAARALQKKMDHFSQLNARLIRDVTKKLKSKGH
jgi:hypothetical protein